MSGNGWRTVNPDMNLVRGILQKLFVIESRDPLVLRENYTLSPPSIEGYGLTDFVLDHVDLLEKAGVLIRTDRLKMTRPPRFVTLEPTTEARHWAEAAFDDEKWESVSGDLFILLTSQQQNSHE